MNVIIRSLLWPVCLAGKGRATRSQRSKDAEASEVAGSVGHSKDEGEEDVDAAKPQINGVSAFELERLENIRRNQEYLAALGLSEAKAQIGLTAVAVEAAKPPKPRAPRKPKSTEK
jgi:hypothetical protein